MLRRLGWLTAVTIGLVFWAYVAGSLYHFEFWHKAVGLLCIGAWLGGPAWAIGKLGWRRAAIGAVGAGAVWVILFHLIQRPRLDRNWSPDQQHTVQIQFSEDERYVEIENVRDFRHASLTEQTPGWDRRRYDLESVQTVDFVLEPLPSFHGMAHTLLSFGFADGRHLAISVEIRKEVGEAYCPIAGIFRQHELVYVVADERDVIALRLNARKHDLYLYPIDAKPQAIRQVLVAMLRRAEKLGRDPEFYHTLTSTCTTNLVRHLDELGEAPLGFQWRVLLPLYADELAWELGLIDGAGSLEEARQRHKIEGPLTVDGDGRAFSKRLRADR